MPARSEPAGGGGGVFNTGLTPDDAAKILSEHLATQQPKSRAYYRVTATRQLAGGAHPAKGKRSESRAAG